MNLIIFGPPGSGKGTYASRISPILGIAHISTGDIFREEIKNKTSLGIQIATYVEKGMLVPDEITNSVLKKRIDEPDCKNGFILDGYPRSENQIKELEKIACIDAIINLIVPDEIIIKRLSSREVCKNCGTIYNKLTLKPKVDGVCDNCGGQLYQRDDDKPNVIKNRLELYKKQIEPLIEIYRKKNFKIIDIEVKELHAPPEKVIDKILDEISRLNS